MSYPTTYISGGPDLAKIPKKGYALIEFNRVASGTRQSMDGKGKEEGNVELEIHSICLPKSGGKDMASDFADFAKKSGVDTGAMGQEAESPEEDEGEGAEES